VFLEQGNFISVFFFLSMVVFRRGFTSVTSRRHMKADAPKHFSFFVCG